MNLNNKAFGDVFVTKLEKEHLDGEIIISTSEYLQGEIIKNGYRNKMYGKVELIPPPKFYEYMKPINDTFVRSTMPTRAYGMNQSMYTGLLYGHDDTKSFISFGKSDALKNKSISKALLKLTCINTDTELVINVNEVLQPWQENNTTYLNQPLIGQLLTTHTIYNHENETYIDLTAYIKELYKNNLESYGFAITTDSGISKGFYTKESKFSPELIIEYTDPYLLNLTVNNIDAEIIVSQTKDKLFDSEINIKDFKNTTKEFIDSEIIISKDTSLAEIIIQKKSDLDGETTVYYDDLRETNGEIIVSRWELPSEMIASVKQEIDGEINVYKIKNQECFAEMDIYHIKSDIINSDITLGFDNFINGEIIKSVSESKNGEMIVLKEDKSDNQGEMNVAFNSDYNGEIIISKSNFINGDVTILKEDKSEINSEIIKGFDKFLDAEIKIPNQRFMDCEIIVKSPNELEAELIIKNIKIDFNGELEYATPYYNSIDSEMNILTGQDKPAEIIIGRTNDFSGELVKLTGQDKSAEIIVRPPNEINSEIIIGITNYINGIMATSVKEVLDLDAEIDTLIGQDKYAEIIVKSPNELDAELIIGFNEVISGIMATSVKDISDLNSEMDVLIGQDKYAEIIVEEFYGYAYIM